MGHPHNHPKRHKATYEQQNQGSTLYELQLPRLEDRDQYRMELSEGLIPDTRPFSPPKLGHPYPTERAKYPI